MATTTWTKKTPTVPGIYWCKNHTWTNPEPALLQVYWRFGSLSLRPLDGTSEHSSPLYFDKNDWWSDGPVIPEPKEPD